MTSSNSDKLYGKSQSSTLYLVINAARRVKSLLKDQTQLTFDSRQSIPYDLFTHIDFTGTSVTELAKRMDCSKQEASRRVIAAEKKGLVNLQAADYDKRVKLVFFSDAGLKMLQEGFQLYQDIEKSLTKKLGKAKMTKINSLLKDLIEALKSTK